MQLKRLTMKILFLAVLLLVTLSSVVGKSIKEHMKDVRNMVSDENFINNVLNTGKEPPSDNGENYDYTYETPKELERNKYSQFYRVFESEVDW